MTKNNIISDWLKENSIQDTKWLVKAKRRKKYKLYYDLIFWLKMKL